MWNSYNSSTSIYIFTGQSYAGFIGIHRPWQLDLKVIVPVFPSQALNIQICAMIKFVSCQNPNSRNLRLSNATLQLARSSLNQFVQGLV